MGYIRMPSMIYLLGVPTHIAVGTDLFEIIISAGYGTVTHAIKGNVDILIELVALSALGDRRANRRDADAIFQGCGSGWHSFRYR